MEPQMTQHSPCKQQSEIHHNADIGYINELGSVMSAYQNKDMYAMSHQYEIDSRQANSTDNWWHNVGLTHMSGNEIPFQ